VAALGWQNRVGFEDGMTRTVSWFRDNAAWWRRVRDADFDAYYQRQYGARLAEPRA
jgi:dTDP-glucose 4,6-dehydratase